MKTYEIWAEGFAATGQAGPASLLGVGKGDTFQEAVRNWGEENCDPNLDIYNLTYWGCGLFDNEEDARKSFG